MRHRRHKGLQDDFDLLLKSKDPHQRGVEFEKLLVRLFHRDGFAARLNAATARPRQTDIYAKRFEDEFIVEAKWHSKPIDISETDSLRSRLRRVPPRLTGLLVSMSGFTEDAEFDVEEHRAQEILLLREDEIVRLFAGKYDLAELIQQKRLHLRTHGKLLFSPVSNEGWPKGTPDLPQTEEFIDIKGKPSRSYLVESDFSQVVFVNLIPEATSKHVYGPVFDLHLDLPIRSAEEMRDCLGWLHQRFELSGEGRFAIQQSKATWLGCGATEFIEELANRDARYSKVKEKHFHHTEYFSYFDEFQDGFLFIHGRNGWPGENSIYMTDLLIRMPGVPIDSRPYLELAGIARSKNVYFVQSELGKPFVFHIKEHLRVEPLARIMSRRVGSEPLVAGLLIENPFYRKQEKIKELIANEVFDNGEKSPLRQLADSAVLMCGLRGWLDPDETEKEYYLDSIRVSWGPDAAFVVSAQCIWFEPASEPSPETAD